MEKKNFTDVESWSVADLVDALTKFQKKRKIIIPKYQRNLVWKDEQKKIFIESIKEGFPIGSLLLYKTDEANNYSLTDGLQRTSTLLHYSQKPTSYFDSNNVNDELVNGIISFFEKKKKLNSEVRLCIVSWVKRLDGFEERDGFSSADLAEEIDKKLGLELTKEVIGNLRKYLVSFVKTIKDKSDIFDFKIPVVIYTGKIENLPTIFERLNTKGTALNKYQVYAATWANEKLKIKNNEIIRHISAKYQKLIDDGLQIENFNGDFDQFAKEDFTFFEYILGLGKLLTSKYPQTFTADKNDDESIGFNLTTICLGISISGMGHLPSQFRKVTNDYLEQQKFESALFKSIEIINAILNPYTGTKLNKSKEKPTIYHTEFQIISLIAKVFKTVYNESNLYEHQGKNPKLTSLKTYIPQHYLFHILQGYWANSGNDKAMSQSNEDNYCSPIPKVRWEDMFNSWNEEELRQKHLSRQRLKLSSRLFLRYIYTHLITTYDEKSSKLFEIEHLVPVSQLEHLKKEYNGIPMNHVGNLALLDKQLNNAKKDYTLYQYADKHKDKFSSKNLVDAERFTFTQKTDLNFTGLKKANNSFDLDDYKKFIKKRFEILKINFYELNKISVNDSQIALFENL